MIAAPKDATPATVTANHDAVARYEMARRGASPGAQLTVSGPKAALVGVVLQPAAAGQLAQAGKIKLDGDPSVLATLAGLMDEFDPDFNIVTP